MRLHYHPGKANVVADALSRKSHVNTLMTGEIPKELAENLRELVGERSNFKKFPTHTQDHGDA